MSGVLTRAEMAARVLEHLGVKAAGQTASAEDNLAATEAIDSAHSRLETEERANFDLDAIPEWAWTPFRDYVARDLVDLFAITGERLQSILSSAARADRDLWVQQAKKYNPDNYQAAKFF